MSNGKLLWVDDEIELLTAHILFLRKKGYDVTTVSNGTDAIEIHLDAIDENDVVLLHDDLLATGGTIKAAWKLVQKLNPKKCYMNFLVEIRDEGLHGREAIGDGIEITTLLTI